MKYRLASPPPRNKLKFQQAVKTSQGRKPRSFNGLSIPATAPRAGAARIGGSGSVTWMRMSRQPRRLAATRISAAVASFPSRGTRSITNPEGSATRITISDIQLSRRPQNVPWTSRGMIVLSQPNQAPGETLPRNVPAQTAIMKNR